MNKGVILSLALIPFFLLPDLCFGQDKEVENSQSHVSFAQWSMDRQLDRSRKTLTSSNDLLRTYTRKSLSGSMHTITSSLYLSPWICPLDAASSLEARYPNVGPEYLSGCQYVQNQGDIGDLVISATALATYYLKQR